MTDIAKTATQNVNSEPGQREINVGRTLSDNYEWQYPKILGDGEGWMHAASSSPDRSRIVIGTGNINPKLMLFERQTFDGFDEYMLIDQIDPANIDDSLELEFISNTTYLVKETDLTRFYDWPHSSNGVTTSGSDFAVSPDYNYWMRTSDGTDIFVNSTSGALGGNYPQEAFTTDVLTDVNGLAMNPSNTVVAQISNNETVDSASLRTFDFDGNNLTTNSTVLRSNLVGGVALSGNNVEFDPTGTYLIDATNDRNVFIGTVPSLNTELYDERGTVSSKLNSISNFDPANPAWYIASTDPQMIRIEATPPFNVYKESFGPWTGGQPRGGATLGDRYIYFNASGDAGIMPVDNP